MMVEVVGIAVLSGMIGMMLGLKIGWRDAKRLYDPYLPGYKDGR